MRERRDIKLSVAFFLLLSLLLFADVSHERKDEAEYWKKVMKDEAIPEILKELLFGDSMVSSDGQNERFMNNFDPHPNAIIYHSHSHSHSRAQAATHNHPAHKIKPSPQNSAP